MICGRKKALTFLRPNPNQEHDLMAQIVTFPRTSCLVRQFEELPLYSEKASNGDVFFAAPVDGTVEISYSDADDWWISAISIKIDNFRMGREAAAKLVEINAEENPSFYWHVLDVFSDKYADTITEWIVYDLEEAA
jgi:hypothetical protein